MRRGRGGGVSSMSGERVERGGKDVSEEGERGVSGRVGCYSVLIGRVG